MKPRLLLRVYNVGLGDCIYLKVPDLNKDVHILIDCGNKFSDLELLGQHIGELKEELPDAGGDKKRLDLLVVTHPHQDHHRGFEAKYFEDVQIERIWLSPAFDRQNPEAQGFHALQDAALHALTSLSELAMGDIKEEALELLNLSNPNAFDMLCNILPEKNKIHPLFVSADTPEEQINFFADPEIRLKVLGPMGNIDAYYLGGEGLVNIQTKPSSLGFVESYKALFQSPASNALVIPKNISSQDFNQLRRRIHANALALAEIAGHVTNNLSVVLLLEWHGRRLLFPGDAEWDGAFKGEVRAKRSNGSWNVMWKERKADLSKPLDFLKVGHHGSQNATPWTPPDTDTGEEHPINQILDHLLPLPQPGQPPGGYAVASTERTLRWPSIPDPDLMAELGKRVVNARTEYVEDPKRKHVPAGTPQPQRTDLEAQVIGKPNEPVSYIKIEFPPE